CVIGADQQAVHLLDVVRGHWTVLEMRDIILAFAARFKPDLVIVEDTSTGMGLIQLLKEYPSIMSSAAVRRTTRRPAWRVSRAGSKPVAFCCRTKRPGCPNSKRNYSHSPMADMTTRSTPCCWCWNGSLRTSVISPLLPR